MKVKVPAPKQTPSGWRIQMRLDGNSIVVTELTKTKCIREAERIKAQYLADGYLDKKLRPSKRIVKSVMEKYYDSVKDVLSPSTVKGYRTILNNRWKDIWYRDINTIKPQEWQKIVNAESKNISAKTMFNAWGFLHTAAKFCGLELPEVKLPKREIKEKAFLSPEQIKPFIGLVKDSEFCIPILLCLSSLRISEVEGLDWADIKEDRIFVHSSVVQSVDGYVKKNTTKNYSSTRYVPIFIQELKDAIEDEREPSGKVMKCSQKRLRHYLHKICTENNLPDLSCHSLRHSFASVCYGRVPEKVCCDIGGWSGTDTVHKIYTHISKSDMDYYVNSLKDFFN